MDHLGGRTAVIAHRGASAHAPEHTTAAYDLALAQGADALELDVRASADGELLVVHDETLLRTAGLPLRVADLGRGTLERLAPGVRPLRLEEVLARYGTRTRLLLDLKAPAPAWELAVPAAVERHGLTDRCVVQSFDVAALARLRARAPWLACAPLFLRRPSRRRLEQIARFAAGVGVWHRLAGPRVVAAAHAHGLAVRVWTVNHPGEIARLVDLGVDGVITDVPALATRIAHAAGPVRQAA